MGAGGWSDSSWSDGYTSKKEPAAAAARPPVATTEAAALETYRVQMDSEWYKVAKEATVKWSSAMETAKGDGETMDQARGRLGSPHCHIMNALFLHTLSLMKSKEPELHKIVSEKVQTWESIHIIGDHIKHAKYSKMYTQDSKRLEVAAPLAATVSLDQTESICPSWLWRKTQQYMVRDHKNVSLLKA